MSTRREFIGTVSKAAVLAGIGGFPIDVLGAGVDQRITILHTNDTHSHIDPWPSDGSRLAGLGGYAQRAALVKSIRQQEQHVLLLDAGDIFQGTPYFNLYKGELEFKLMSEMKYDAATIGNHDFDAGLDGLVKQLPHASFPFICSNYDFSKTSMKDRTAPYHVFKLGKVRVGVLGVGIELDGLVPSKLFGETRYLDPISRANETAEHLKGDERCQYLIALSHLGFKYADDRVSDLTLAKQSRNIDLIIGGHTHTFLDAPVRAENLDGREVWINQVGWAGVKLGRIDVSFRKNFTENSLSHKTVNVTTCAS